jgi:hypothetical protein
VLIFLSTFLLETFMNIRSIALAASAAALALITGCTAIPVGGGGQPQPAAAAPAASAIPPARSCAAHIPDWKRLNWPGHPQHGNWVCMAKDDKHRFPNE